MDKPGLLTVPSGRLRSKTITTPVGTPLEGPSVFLTDDQLQTLLRPSANHWDRLPRELKSHVLSYLSATDKIRTRSVGLMRSLLMTGQSRNVHAFE